MTTSKIEEGSDDRRPTEWQGKRSELLFELADKDEWREEYSWPILKDEIKEILKETFEKWPSSSSPILHPAATLIPLNSSNIDDVSTSSSSLSSSNLPSSAANGNGTNSNGNHSNTQRNYAQQALNNRFMMEGANDDTEGGNGIDQDISIKESDMQAFFPSKRQAPAEWRGSWGKRIDTFDELQKEQRIINEMLDDFENQPPFTIQRLAELILQPTQHHHTLPKYISALKRVLAVTATRDAFPARVEEEEEDMLTAEDALFAAAGNEAEMINGTLTGAAGNRSRKSTPGISTAQSPTSTPLFSPIPFLMKSGDEGMPGAGPMGINEQGELSQEERSEVAMLDRDVPSMELAGADRTTEEAADKARREGKGSGTNKSVIDGVNEHLDDSSDSVTANLSAEETKEVEINGNSSTDAETNTIVQKVASDSIPSSKSEEIGEIGHAGELASTNPTSSATSAVTSEPLGVPAGPVDEVDQIGDKHGQMRPIEPGSIAGGARAFSSTTGGGGNLVEQKEDEEPHNDEGRALKRVKSDRHLANDENTK